jgi:hypothetical protein
MTARYLPSAAHYSQLALGHRSFLELLQRAYRDRYANADPNRSAAARRPIAFRQPRSFLLQYAYQLRSAEPRRVHDRGHVRYLATQRCLVCGRSPSDAHHLRFAQSRAPGRRWAMSLVSHYVEGTIAPCTVTATKSDGGRRSVSTLASRRERYGLNPWIPGGI